MALILPSKEQGACRREKAGLGQVHRLAGAQNNAFCKGPRFFRRISQVLRQAWSRLSRRGCIGFLAWLFLHPDKSLSNPGTSKILQNEKTMIHILPESEAHVLVVRATGKLTVEDYENVFIPALQHLMARYRTINLVFHCPAAFEGWEPGALWEDASFGFRHRNDFSKVALVGGPDWMAWAAQVCASLTAGEVRTFEAGQFVDAIAWAKSA
jgi:hypothetical protein